MILIRYYIIEATITKLYRGIRPRIKVRISNSSNIRRI